MNIFYTFNNKFIPQVAASITSVCENNKHVKTINFYLAHTDLTKENQTELKNFIKTNYHRNVHFIKLNNLQTYFDFKFDTNGWNPIVLARLLVDKLLPKSLDRVLYLDGDTIIRGDLEPLYQTDLKSKPIAASIEPTIDRKRKAQLGLQGYPYYNAGVLLINLDNWRHQKTGEQIIKFYESHNGQLFANDQDAINASQKGNIYTLSPAYNYYNIFDQYSYRFLASLCDFPYIKETTYKSAKQNPIIIHYLGEERPWRIGNTHRFKSDFEHYLSMTPPHWQSEATEPGWRLYFICWNIFNFITKPFPHLRHKIITNLIPVFMKYRSKQLTKNQEK